MQHSPHDLLRHILDEIEYVLGEAEDMDRQEFLRHPTLQRSFVRSLEIIGEATKKLPMHFRSAHKEIEWRGMAGMRDRLIHDYFAVDYELVWDVVRNKLPVLHDQIQKCFIDP